MIIDYWVDISIYQQTKKEEGIYGILQPQLIGCLLSFVMEILCLKYKSYPSHCLNFDEVCLNHKKVLFKITNKVFRRHMLCLLQSKQVRPLFHLKIDNTNYARGSFYFDSCSSCHKLNAIYALFIIIAFCFCCLFLMLKNLCHLCLKKKQQYKIEPLILTQIIVSARCIWLVHNNCNFLLVCIFKV